MLKLTKRIPLAGRMSFLPAVLLFAVALIFGGCADDSGSDGDGGDDEGGDIEIALSGTTWKSVYSSTSGSYTTTVTYTLKYTSLTAWTETIVTHMDGGTFIDTTATCFGTYTLVGNVVTSTMTSYTTESGGTVTGPFDPCTGTIAGNTLTLTQKLGNQTATQTYTKQ